MTTTKILEELRDNLLREILKLIESPKLGSPELIKLAKENAVNRGLINVASHINSNRNVLVRNSLKHVSESSEIVKNSESFQKGAIRERFEIVIEKLVACVICILAANFRDLDNRDQYLKEVIGELLDEEHQQLNLEGNGYPFEDRVNIYMEAFEFIKKEIINFIISSFTFSLQTKAITEESFDKILEDIKYLSDLSE